MEKRKILYAKEGKIFTNGNMYGKIIYLADDLDEHNFYEITESEYEMISKKPVEDIV